MKLAEELAEEEVKKLDAMEAEKASKGLEAPENAPKLIDVKQELAEGYEVKTSFSAQRPSILPQVQIP